MRRTSDGAAIDFVRAVGPRQIVPIHDIMFSDVGVESFAKFLGQDGLARVLLRQLEAGDSLDV